MDGSSKSGMSVISKYLERCQSSEVIVQTNLSKEFKGIIDLTAAQDSKGLHHYDHLTKGFIKHHLGART